jgi:hypothetical protein
MGIIRGHVCVVIGVEPVASCRVLSSAMAAAVILMLLMLMHTLGLGVYFVEDDQLSAVGTAELLRHSPRGVRATHVVASVVASSEGQ